MDFFTQTAINNGIYYHKQRKKNKADSLTNTLQKSPTGPSRNRRDTKLPFLAIKSLTH